MQSRAEAVGSLACCALAAEAHPSPDPAETNGTHSGHFLLSFLYTCSVAFRRKSRLFVLLRRLSFRTGEGDH